MKEIQNKGKRNKKIVKNKEKIEKSYQTLKEPDCPVFNCCLKDTPNFLKQTCSFETICFKSLNMSENIKPESVLLLVFGADLKILKPLLIKKIKTLLIKNQKYKQATEKEVSYERYENFKIIERSLNQTFVNQYRNNIQVQLNVTFHPKLFLIKFKNFLRIVIGSGNLFVEDWDFWNNIFYIQDFPLKIKQKINYQENSFEQDLQYYLENSIQNELEYLNKELQIDIHSYDYSQAKVSLVSSFPGFFDNSLKSKQKDKNDLNELKQSGLNHFQLQFSQFKYSNPNYLRKQKLDIFFVTSSLGASNIRFIHQFIETIFPFKKAESLEQLYANWEQFSNMFHLIYPSQDFVERTYNPSKFKPYFLLKEYFDEFWFEKSILSVYETKQEHLEQQRLSHVKMFVSLVNNKVTDDSVIYIGSHNFTKQAWGKYYEKQCYYQINNNELGVIFGPQKGSRKMKQKILQIQRFKIPCKKYHEESQPYMNS